MASTTAGLETLRDDERDRWMNGTRAEADAVMAAVKRGTVRCDDCPAPAVAMGHHGTGTKAWARCAEDYLAMVERDRANRPTRDELVARVNRAIAR